MGVAEIESGGLPPVLLFLVVFINYVYLSCCQRTQRASHFCKVDPSNANGAIINFGVVPKSDTIYRIYAYDASQGNTLTGTRIDDCYIENTAADPTQDRIEMDLIIDFGASTHSCGVYLTGTTVKTMTFLFRAQAISGLITGDDVVYTFQCLSDELSDNEVATPGYSGSEAVEVDLAEPNTGVTMRVRHATTHIPMNTVPLGTKVYLSIEFVKGKNEGPDNWGTHFFVGILGNDNIALNSSESLFVAILPRDTIRTFMNVTTVYGSETKLSENGELQVFDLHTELMGCSDDNVAEIGNKGIEIAASHEVAVLVCNRESDTEDCYTALPLDVIDTEYFAISRPSVNEISELMIIATEDSTNVDLTLPSFTGLTITLNNTSKSAGETLTFTLQKRESFHLAVHSASSSESVVGFKVQSDKPVSVISGMRKHVNDHMAEQVPGNSKLGKHYVLTPADPFDDGKTTTYIIQATVGGVDTTVTQYTDSGTQNFTISLSTSPPLMISITTVPCEIISDQPLMVAQIVDHLNTANGLETAMLILPSVQQWSFSYSVLYSHSNSASLRATFVFPNEAAATALTMKMGESSFPTSASPVVDVLGPSGYKFYSARPLSANTVFGFSSTDAITQFLPMLYATSGNKNTGVAFLPFGLRYPTTGECPTTRHKQGDLIDNDCDGLVDEELLNLLDDDGDGNIDEDLVNSAEEFVNAFAIRPHSCQASGQSDFLDVAKLKPMTLATGCLTTEDTPFTPKANFTVTTTAAGVSIYNSGEFEMAMFEEQNTVYFKCELDTCLKDNDPTCTPVCQPTPEVRRRKREEKNETSVVTFVQVVPNTVQPDTCSNVSVGERHVDPISCFENSYVLAIFIVLIILVILSFSTAICFCCLFRQRRNESKTRTRYWCHRKSL